MKKFSLMLFLFLSFLLCSIFPNTVHADNQDSVLYDIQIEYLKNSNDANELNSYRKEFLKYLNQQVNYTEKQQGKKHIAISPIRIWILMTVLKCTD